MTTLFPTLRKMNSDLNRWFNNDDFDDIFNFNDNWMPKMSVAAPAINVKETDKEYDVEVAAPGASKEDFNVNLDNDGNLVIKMEHKDEKKDENKKTHYLRREFASCNYQQALTLPEDVDRNGINAKVENGVLHITLPRTAKAEKETKRIEVA